MPDFLKIERPYAPPTYCLICNTHACPDGFVDTGRELPGYAGMSAGRVYVCAWCVSSAAKLFEFVDGEQHTKLRNDFAELLVTVDKLEGELATERDKVLVSVADLEKVVSGRKLSKAARD